MPWGRGRGTDNFVGGADICGGTLERVKKPPKGHRLAVSLPPRWPRWSSLLLSTLVTGFYVGIVYYFIYGTQEAVHRKSMVALLCGSIGLFCAGYWALDLLRWVVAGDTIVEIS